jgi:DNA-binding NarL/FixJ family response regulator
LNNLADPPVEWVKRSCCRCGEKFRPASERQRVCPSCRRPQQPSHLQPALPELSERERQVAELVTLGRPNKAIASELHLSERTVGVYLSRMFRKVRVGNRTELALLALKTAEESK